MPIWRRLGGRSSMLAPSISTWPSAWRVKPATMRSSVVLPQPEGPSSARISPGSTARLTASSAVKAP